MLREGPEGLAATKRIVAALRAGQSGDESAAWGAARRKGAAAQERIAAFTARKRPEPR